MILYHATKTQCVSKLRLRDEVFFWANDCEHDFVVLNDQRSGKLLEQPYPLNKQVSLIKDASEEKN